MSGRALCQGECKRNVRFETKQARDKYKMCRPCFSKANGRPRPITGRQKKTRIPSTPKAATTPQKGKKG